MRTSCQLEVIQVEGPGVRMCYKKLRYVVGRRRQAACVLLGTNWERSLSRDDAGAPASRRVVVTQELGAARGPLRPVSARGAGRRVRRRVKSGHASGLRPSDAGDV